MDAHNIYLEQIRRNGIIAGSVLAILYVLMILKSSRVLILPSLDPTIIGLAATVVSVGVIGGLFGQFVLMATFSFFFMGLAGVFSGIYSNEISSRQID